MITAEKFHGTLYGTPQECHPGKSLIGRGKLRAGAASSLTTHNLLVAGSNPAGPTKRINRLHEWPFLNFAGKSR
jgi:hypothetical protein